MAEMLETAGILRVRAFLALFRLVIHLMFLPECHEGLPRHYRRARTRDVYLRRIWTGVGYL